MTDRPRFSTWTRHAGKRVIITLPETFYADFRWMTGGGENGSPPDMDNQIVKFVRKKDFVLEKRLGQGATGNTVLLFDSTINERFACKKYAPANPAHADRFFDAFLKEIKLLHLMNHTNVVRVFNYYLFPERKTGYILMEYVDGEDIGFHLLINSDKINNIFSQVISGFSYLEENEILHRDIRESNILVNDKGVVKIIDFGFGKQAQQPKDYANSIFLNWWCPLPNELRQSIYDFRTEVYFVGKLFEKLIADHGIENFEHSQLLERMCAIDPEDRITSFSEVRGVLLQAGFGGVDFSWEEKHVYQEFASALSEIVSSIDKGAKYHADAATLLSRLEERYRSVMLEDRIPNPNMIAQCFINGAYRYLKRPTIRVETLKEFIDMFRRVSTEKQNIILANLHARLDSKDRYQVDMDDDIPF
ncbi:protein kinase family protein [Paraburkholderia sp. A1RI_3L]|uniref:protein kinase family protein n=1 Tax=Paraburkholderia TaxID=1822464 RepID=UPI003B803FBC